MKIITDNAAYVQRKDLIYLNTETYIEMPETILLKMFDNYKAIKSEQDFVKFEDGFDIEFFRSINWIVDYNEVKDLSEDEMIKLGQSITDEKNALSDRFYSMDIDGRLKNFDLVARCDLLKYKMQSLADIIFYKRGEIVINLPDDVINSKEKIKI